ncbi:MAG: cytochrome c biogenesis protein CcsA, partial [Cyclobacteriaceae bacterium]|nr:cytochrome c biogenesis protein CcsA [Cyclobacteriaceae bacterium]
IPFYLEGLQKSIVDGDYTNSDQIVESIKKYQAKFGAEVMPSETKINLEIAYNKINIFERLYPFYMLIGFVFLIMLYVRLLIPSVKLKWGIKGMQWLIIAAFLIHATGLAMRWYISGHEPWSNGYESMLYIAWAGLLAGIIFRQKSPITMAVTSILAGIILFVAHLSWMDPEITNLVPVLKSYWLTIHVATITASYGFLALGALLAFVNILTMMMRRDSNRHRLNLTIKEVTYVIEMTLIVGLVMLTIGNFLGGIWANESWGRYWGWDPKETWAMASIIFYAFVLHMRFIPGLRGPYAFNFAAMITFSSIIMTYFGVNYYLSGLHSYAKGDPVPIPDFVYYTLGVIAVVSILAFISELTDRKKNKAKPKRIVDMGVGE